MKFKQRLFEFAHVQQLKKEVKKLTRMQIIVIAGVAVLAVGFGSYALANSKHSKPDIISNQEKSTPSTAASESSRKSSSTTSGTISVPKTPSKSAAAHDTGGAALVTPNPYQWFECGNGFSFGYSSQACSSTPFDITDAGPCNGITTTSCTMQINSDQQIMAFVPVVGTVEAETTYSQYKFICNPGAGCDLPAHSIIQKLDGQTYQTNESTTFCCSLIHAIANTGITLEAPSSYSYWQFTHGATTGDPTYVMKFKNWAVSYHTPITVPAGTDYYQVFSAAAADKDTSSMYVAPIYTIACHYLNTGGPPPCTP